MDNDYVDIFEGYDKPFINKKFTEDTDKPVAPKLTKKGVTGGNIYSSDINTVNINANSNNNGEVNSNSSSSNMNNVKLKRYALRENKNAQKAQIPLQKHA